MNLLTPPEMPPSPMTIDEFFDWTETQERRYELVEGVACMMTMVKRGHSLIAGNIVAALRTQIDLDAYFIHQGDFALPTGPASVRYADVMVERRGGSVEDRATDSAVVLVEILSESTKRVDFGAKAREYMRLPSLECYLIVDQHRREAWLWARDAAGHWPDAALHLTAPDAQFRLEAVACTLGFDDVYRDVR